MRRANNAGSRVRIPAGWFSALLLAGLAAPHWPTRANNGTDWQDRIPPESGGGDVAYPRIGVINRTSTEPPVQEAAYAYGGQIEHGCAIRGDIVYYFNSRYETRTNGGMSDFRVLFANALQTPFSSPAIAASPNGRFAAVGWVASNPNRVYIMRKDALGTWGTPFEYPAPTGKTYTLLNVQVEDNGQVHFLIKSSTSPVQHALIYGTTPGSLIQISTNLLFGYRGSIEISPTTGPHVLWVEELNPDRTVGRPRITRIFLSGTFTTTNLPLFVKLISPFPGWGWEGSGFRGKFDALGELHLVYTDQLLSTVRYRRHFAGVTEDVIPLGLTDYGDWRMILDSFGRPSVYMAQEQWAQPGGPSPSQLFPFHYAARVHNPNLPPGMQWAATSPRCGV